MKECLEGVMFTHPSVVSTTEQSHPKAASRGTELEQRQVHSLCSVRCSVDVRGKGANKRCMGQSNKFRVATSVAPPDQSEPSCNVKGIYARPMPYPRRRFPDLRPVRRSIRHL
jgi:hypothetical protein